MDSRIGHEEYERQQAKPVSTRTALLEYATRLKTLLPSNYSMEPFRAVVQHARATLLLPPLINSKPCKPYND